MIGMMREIYETPHIEVIEVDIENVLCASPEQMESMQSNGTLGDWIL